MVTSCVPRVFCDLDGVLADFELQMLRVAGLERARCTEDEMWAAINKYEEDGGEWFYDLPLTRDAETLWATLEHLTPTILTATGRNGEVHGPQKIRWVARHFGEDVEVIVVRRSEDKAAYARPGDILIDDDFPRSITSWEAAGGIGVHHVDFRRTLYQLTKLQANNWRR